MGIWFGGCARPISSGANITITNYATSTALDLKADKADLTTLSEIVGTPAEMTYDYVVERAMRDLFGNSYDASGVFPTTGTRIKTHQTVRFLFGFLCPGKNAI